MRGQRRARCKLTDNDVTQKTTPTGRPLCMYIAINYLETELNCQ